MACVRHNTSTFLFILFLFLVLSCFNLHPCFANTHTCNIIEGNVDYKFVRVNSFDPFRKKQHMSGIQNNSSVSRDEILLNCASKIPLNFFFDLKGKLCLVSVV